MFLHYQPIYNKSPTHLIPSYTYLHAFFALIILHSYTSKPPEQLTHSTASSQTPPLSFPAFPFSHHPVSSACIPPITSTKGLGTSLVSFLPLHTCLTTTNPSTASLPATSYQHILYRPSHILCIHHFASHLYNFDPVHHFMPQHLFLSYCFSILSSTKIF